MLRPTVCGPDEKNREAVLLADLYQMRSCIDVHFERTGRYPREMSDLVDIGLLRSVPTDPMTMSADTWLLERNAAGEIFDIRSGALGTGLDGTSYRDW